MASKRPFIILVPGASQNPSHYGYFLHLLQLAGYPTFTALLPSIGSAEHVTVEDDANYVRNKMLLPVLDFEEHDAILVTHSYSGVPGSAAARGLSKDERTKQGKKTGVLGQIFLAALVAKGGDGKNLLETFGGQHPPHIRPDQEANLLRCDDRIPPMYQDIPSVLADAVAVSAVAHSMTSFDSPLPRASWDSDEYKGRVAYIRTLDDAGLPLQIQQMMIDGSATEWFVKDIKSGHSPQISQPEKLTEIFLELIRTFESV